MLHSVGCARGAGEQTLARYVIDFEPDAVGVLEQHRVIARRPCAIVGRMDNRGADPQQKLVDRVDVAALARAQADVMQSDPPLRKALAAGFLLGLVDADPGAAADTIEL